MGEGPGGELVGCEEERAVFPRHLPFTLFSRTFWKWWEPQVWEIHLSVSE